MIRVRLKVPSPALHAGLRALLATDAEVIVLHEDLGPESGSPQENDADVIITTSASMDPVSLGFTEQVLQPAVLFLGTRPMSLGRLLQIAPAAGILPVDASAEELLAAVRALSAGLTVAATDLLTTSDQPSEQAAPLTERETEVLRLLARGLANKQIALELGVSEHTVKFHVSAIYNKLNVASRTQAVREGLRNGWIAL